LTSPGTFKIDRPKIHPDLTTHPIIKTRTLFADPKAEAVRFFKKTGVFPPHHITVIRESIVQKHPWVATSLLEAFEKAKKLAMEQFYSRPPSMLMFGRELVREQRATFGDDPYVYGVRANANAVDMFQTFCVEQGLIEQKLPLEVIYPEEILIAEQRLLD
jgi:4,5-dihydroxyphthalate decarboxylase